MALSPLRSSLHAGFLASFICRQAAEKTFRTSSVVYKRKPKSVHIPRWSQALVKRYRLNKILSQPRSERRIAAEERLSKDTREIVFKMACVRLGSSNKVQNYPTRDGPRPKLMLSDDKSMIISYHPSKSYPLEFTKPMPTKPVWYMTEEETKGYSHTLTEKQGEEAQKLVSEDPNVWSLRALSHLLQVQPEAIKKVFKLSEEQRRYLKTEKDYLDEMPPKKRVEYRRIKLWEILNYTKETRGIEFASAMKKRMLYRPGFS